MAKNVIGIDAGSYGLKLAFVSGDEVKKTAFAATPEGLMRNGEMLSGEATADFIRQTAKAAGISRGEGAVVLPDAAVYSKTVTLPAMSDAQIKYSLPYELRDYVSEDKNEYFYDYAVQHIITDADGKPAELELYACVSPKNVIADYRSMMRRAGYKMRTAVPAAWAYGNLVSRHIDKGGDAESTYCIIDLGYEKTDIFMFSGKNFVTRRSAALGTFDIERAAADELGVDEFMARSYILTDYKNVLSSDACRAVYNGIAVEIVKAVNYYNFNNRGQAISAAYLAGGGSRLEPLMAAMPETVEIEMRDISRIMPAFTGDEPHPGAFAKAVGAALQ